jgi:lipopolysaccharide transport system ATP-binding protein
MGNSIIEINNLSKVYRINNTTRKEGYKTLRDQITNSLFNTIKVAKNHLNNQFNVQNFNEYHALKNLNLEIERGDTIGLIGRNGAGKSTLLKVLSRITEPTSGRITLKGRVASLLEVGTGFHPELTGRENIFLNGAILGMKRGEVMSKFDKIVDFSGIEEFIDTPVKRYSSGMYVRLAFSVAAHLESDILFVDEVLAVGDAEFQRKCLGKLDDISNNYGRTVIFVSHNIDSIKSLCKKGILLEKGEIAYVGEINQTLLHYSTGLLESNNNTYKNNSSSSDVYISSAICKESLGDSFENNKIIIELEITVNKKSTFSFESVVKNEKGISMFFNSNGIVNNEIFTLASGKYYFDFELTTPFLASGKYLIDLMIASPGSFFYDIVENSLVHTVINSNIGRLVFKQNDKQGCVYLNSSIKFKNNG